MCIYFRSLCRSPKEETKTTSRGDLMDMLPLPWKSKQGHQNKITHPSRRSHSTTLVRSRDRRSGKFHLIAWEPVNARSLQFNTTIFLYLVSELTVNRVRRRVSDWKTSFLSQNHGNKTAGALILMCFVYF